MGHDAIVKVGIDIYTEIKKKQIDKRKIQVLHSLGAITHFYDPLHDIYLSVFLLAFFLPSLV